MGRLDDKVAIITGAEGGMGFADAVLFAKEGAKVVATDVDLGRLEENYKDEDTDDILLRQLDVTQEDDWKKVVDETIEKFGKIDILVNNAGIHIAKNVVDAEHDDYFKVLEVNTYGVSLGMKYVIPKMQENGKGSIVNISSIAGILAGPGADGGGHAYSASKGAVRSMTKNVAMDYAKDNIRANTIHPGSVFTPIMEKAGMTFEMATETYSENNPLPPHIGEPYDIAYGVLYLASDESKFVTGQELVIDGGFMTH